MATDPAEGAVLRQMVNFARKDSVNFAFYDGTLLIDRRKPAAALAKEARKLGGTRVAHGAMRANGTVVTLECEADIPNLAKLVRAHLKANGVSAEVTLAAGPDGGSGTSDPAPGEPAETVPESDIVAVRRQWAATRSRVHADLKALLNSVAEATRDMPDLSHATRELARQAQPVAKLDGTLDKILARLETAQGAERDKLRAAARQVARSHMALMKSDFFEAVDTNGFADTRIRASVLEALKGIDDALKAQS